MGLVFTVGNANDVFSESFADRVKRTLDVQFLSAFVLDSDDDPFYSEEISKPTRSF